MAVNKQAAHTQVELEATHMQVAIASKQAGPASTPATHTATLAHPSQVAHPSAPSDK